MNIKSSQFNVEWLPPAAEANEPDLVAFQGARRDTETLIEQMLARGYDRDAVMRGVSAGLSKFSGQG